MTKILTLFILGSPVPFQSYCVTVLLVLPHNLFTGPAIPVCFQTTPTAAPGPSKAETAGAFDCAKNWVWVSQAMRLRGREHVPPPLYFIPCYSPENCFDTTLDVKAHHVICSIPLSHYFCSLSWHVPSAPSKAISLSPFPEHLQYGKQWGRPTPARSWVVPMPQFPASPQAFICMGAQPKNPSLTF